MTGENGKYAAVLALSEKRTIRLDKKSRRCRNYSTKDFISCTKKTFVDS